VKASPRLLALVAVAALVAAVAAETASAHVRVVSRSPAANGTATTSLRTVKIRFSGPLRSGTLKVFRNGRKVSVGNGGRDPRNIRRLVTTMNRNLSTGWYTAKWTIVAADGHRQSGSWRFRLRRP
jgi:methionine-rich copper-binding protein CopC